MALTPVDKKATSYLGTGVNEPVGPEGVGEGVQVAGALKTFLDFLQAAGSQQNRVKPPERTLGVLGEDRYPSRSSGKVPTRQTEGLMLGGQYRATQEEVAPKVLSEEGHERFVEQGHRAVLADTTNPDEVLRRARAALNADAKGTELKEGHVGQVSEETAEAVLDAQQRAQAAIIDNTDLFGRSSLHEGIDFNFDLIETGDDVKALLNATSEVYSPSIKEGKRGVRTHAETIAAAETLLADELGTTRSILRRRTGELLNAETMRAAQILLLRSTERLAGYAEQIAPGGASAETMLKFRRQMALHAALMMQVKGAQTEIGRAMNAFKIPKGTQGPQATQAEIFAILNESGGSTEATKMAQGYLKALENGRGAANQYVHRGWSSKVNGIWQEAYVNGLLFWTTTMLKNLFATPLFMTYQLAEELAAGVWGTGVRTTARAFGGKPAESGAFLGSPFVRAYGWGQELGDAWNLAWHTFKNEMPGDQLSKIEVNTYRQIDAENLGVSGPAGQWIDMLGKVIRIPQRLLLGTDEFWKAMASRGELNVQAYEATLRSKALGASDVDAVDDGMMVMLDPKSVEDEMSAAAHYVTLTTDLGAFGKVTSFIQRHPLGRIIMPFTKAPSNAILLTMERIPGLNLIGKTARLDLLGKNGPKARQKRISQMAFGTGVMWSISELAINGRLTGSFPRDDRIARNLPPGWQPYSMVFKSSDEEWPKDADGDDLPLIDPKTGLYNGPVMYISYAGLEPVGAILGITADVVERNRREPDPVKRMHYAQAALHAGTDYFLQLPFLQGFSSIYSALSRNDMSYMTNSPLGNLLVLPTGDTIPGIKGLPTPVPKIAGSAWRNIGKAIDPVSGRVSSRYEYFSIDEVMAMESYPNGEPRYDLVGMPKAGLANFFKHFVIDGYNTALRDSPYYDVSEALAINYDIYGKPIMRSERFDTSPFVASWNLMTPFRIRYGEEPDELTKELIKVGMPLTREASQWLQGVRLSHKNRSDWTYIAKNETEIAGKILGLKPPSQTFNFNQALVSMIASKEYDKPDLGEGQTIVEARHNKLRLLQDKFYQKAIPSLLAMPENEGLYTAITEVQRIKAMRHEIDSRGAR